MKSIWTDGPVRWHRPFKSRMKVLWTLWALGYALLALWLLGMAAGHMMHGWIHALAAGAVAVAGVCTYYGFKYCEFLEPIFIARDSKLRRSPPDPTDADDNAEFLKER